MMHGDPLSASAAYKRFGRLKAKMELEENQRKARKPRVKSEKPRVKSEKPKGKSESPKKEGLNKARKIKVEPEIKDEDEWIF